MIKRFGIVFFSILMFSSAYAQIYNLRFVLVHNDSTDGGNYDVKLQISSNSMIKLATSNITFNFSDGISTPTLLETHNFDNDINPAYKNMTLNESYSGVASINIVFNGTNSSIATDVDTNFVDVATIRFLISNSIQLSGLFFRDSLLSNTVVYDCSGEGIDFSTNLLNAGIWDNLDEEIPVELSPLSVEVDQNSVILNWHTDSEANNYGFEIERSSNSDLVKNLSWLQIGFVKGSGTSTSKQDYKFKDDEIFGHRLLNYRIKQIDLNGDFIYSNVVAITVAPNEFKLYQNYPNPFNPITNIKFALKMAAKVNLTIYNLLGERIKTLIDEEKEPGFYRIPFNASSLSTGVYLYRFVAADYIQTNKMTLIK